MKRKLLVLLAILAVLCWATVASADLFPFSLSNPNSAIAGFPAPYANVTVSTNGSNVATFTFTGASFNTGPGGFTSQYLLGGAQVANVNLNLAGFLPGTTVTIGGFSASTLSFGGAGNADGFGLFNITLDNFDGYASALTSLTFTATLSGGQTWGAASTVLTANNGGSTAAAHIFVPNGTLGTGGTATAALSTGFASNGNPVPIPPTALLLGSGLLGIVVLGRRRGRSNRT